MGLINGNRLDLFGGFIQLGFAFLQLLTSREQSVFGDQGMNFKWIKFPYWLISFQFEAIRKRIERIV